MDKKHANASSNNSLANTPHAHHRTPVLPGVRHVHPGRECDPGILWEQQRKCVRSGRRRCIAVLLLLVQRRHHPKFERYTGRHLHPLSHRRRGHTGERPSGRAQYRGLSPYTYVWNTGATTMTITGWSSRSTTPPTTRRTAFDPISIETHMRLRDVANASMPLEETRCQPGCAHRP